MKINVISISKRDKKFDMVNSDFLKMSIKYSKINDIILFNNQIAKFQQLSLVNDSKKSYSKILQPHLGKFNIALDVNGKGVDSFEFAKLLENQSEVNFFIAGAYGFEKDFIDKCNSTISLSSLTMSHQLAKSVLFEQIFRGLSINNNHPYHK